MSVERKGPCKGCSAMNPVRIVWEETLYGLIGDKNGLFLETIEAGRHACVFVDSSNALNDFYVFGVRRTVLKPVSGPPQY